MSGLPEGLLVARCREVGSIQHVIYYFYGRDVGITRRFISCHGVVRLVLSNGYILFPWP